MAVTGGGAKPQMAITGGGAKWNTFFIVQLRKKESSWNNILRKNNAFTNPADPLSGNHLHLKAASKVSSPVF